VAESAPITNGKIEKKFLSVEFGDDGAFDPSNADHVNAIMHNHQSELAGAIIPSVFDYLGQMGSFPELSQSLGGVIISYADRYLADDFKEQVKNLNQEEGEIKQGRATVTVDKLQMICDELLKEDGRIKPALIALLKNGRKQLFKTFKKLVREEYGVTPVTVGQKQAGIIYDENRCLTPASDVFFSADGIFGGDGDGGTPHDFLSVQIKLEQLLDTESDDSHRAQSDAGVKVVTLVMVLIEQSLRAKKAKAKGGSKAKAGPDDEAGPDDDEADEALAPTDDEGQYADYDDYSHWPKKMQIFENMLAMTQFPISPRLASIGELRRKVAAQRKKTMKRPLGSR